jgi:hypothetical protein
LHSPFRGLYRAIDEALAASVENPPEDVEKNSLDEGGLVV